MKDINGNDFEVGSKVVRRFGCYKAFEVVGEVVKIETGCNALIRVKWSDDYSVWMVPSDIKIA